MKPERPTVDVAELERARRRAEHRENVRRREKRAIAFLALVLFIGGLAILAEQARAARPPVPAPIFKAVRAEWRSPADRRKAFDVVACETGNTYDLEAANGQYLGIFQMGSRERRICGHGPTARAQARAARCWFDKTGADWSPWTCA
jgi:hypothetical protein